MHAITRDETEIMPESDGWMGNFLHMALLSILLNSTFASRNKTGGDNRFLILPDVDNEE